MNIIQTFANLAGFYVLTDEGDLGYYEKDGTFSVDASLTKSFKSYNKQFLTAYLKNTGMSGARIAIIYNSSQKKPWGNSIFALETEVLHSLYPVDDIKHDVSLTEFQKKNREKSIYRGTELLLEYQNEKIRSWLSYCPVLYDRDSKLCDYPGLFDPEVDGSVTDSPVLEVLNLIAFISNEKRKNPAILGLKKSIHDNVVRKNKRNTEFTIVENNEFKSDQSFTEDPSKIESAKKYRNLAIPVWEKTDVRAWMEKSWGEKTGKSLGPWLVQPYQFPTIDMLKGFQRFKDYGVDGLTEAADNNPIFKAPAGTSLLAQGTNDNWNIYLLDGTLELIAGNGNVKNVAGGTEQASAPVAFLKPRICTVRSLTQVKFLFISEDFIAKMPKSQSGGLQILDDTPPEPDS